MEESKMEDTIKMLADAPEEERRSMIQERIEMFLEMPEEKRLESIKQLVNGISKLPDEKQKAVIAARTEAMAKLPGGKRLELMKSRMKAGELVSEEVHKKDMKLTEESVPSLPKEQQKNFKQTKEALSQQKAVKNPASAPKVEKKGGAPYHHDKPMEEVGFLNKKWKCQVCDHEIPR